MIIKTPDGISCLGALLEEVLALEVLVNLGVGHDTANLRPFVVGAVVHDVDDADRRLSLTARRGVLLPLLDLAVNLLVVPVDGVCVIDVSKNTYIGRLCWGKGGFWLLTLPQLSALDVATLDSPLDVVAVAVVMGVTALALGEGGLLGLVGSVAHANLERFGAGLVVLGSASDFTGAGLELDSSAVLLDWESGDRGAGKGEREKDLSEMHIAGYTDDNSKVEGLESLVMKS